MWKSQALDITLSSHGLLVKHLANIDFNPQSTNVHIINLQYDQYHHAHHSPFLMHGLHSLTKLDVITSHPHLNVSTMCYLASKKNLFHVVWMKKKAKYLNNIYFHFRTTTFPFRSNLLFSIQRVFNNIIYKTRRKILPYPIIKRNIN